ncbi:unnamed protein product [Rangifer tarandus platyrhynchus]|uniref:Uncharacterized protein n=2 Tax=Rangifer tarandus platyrhynchus TaxID=3082113 RepID=A0ACB0EZ73_RANTA|nr:unnamed protein product [Rangifer tarandus platyrhynchus]CAI9705672.1 unnamed protein product [Rangifer tarandus platyrhynchus]
MAKARMAIALPRPSRVCKRRLGGCRARPHAVSASCFLDECAQLQAWRRHLDLQCFNPQPAIFETEENHSKCQRT